MRRGVPVLLVLALVVGCSSNGATGSTTTTTDAPPTTAETTTTTQSTTTTVEETTTTTEPPSTTAVDDTIPYPDNTGTDWFKIVTELEAFGGWLGEHPDPSLIRLIAVESSPIYKGIDQVISEYATSGWRDLPGGRAEILAAEFAAGVVDLGEVQVRVASDYDGATTVDSEGTVVRTTPDEDPKVTTWTLRGSEAEGWRLYSVTYVGPYEGSDA